MDVGVMVPQGWKGEFDGWPAAGAWATAIARAQQAEALGFESLWVFDHFTTTPDPTQEITFESFTMLAALAQATSRVRIGHMVICTGFRNPALTAKMASTIDVISGGRFELGIGAGWKEDEWLAYGFGFPTLRDRLGALGDHLEVIRRMLGPGKATFEGAYARVEGAINVPKGIQSHIPIVVGGNGQNVTFRYAARYADELNLVFLGPDEIRDVLPVVRERCAEVGRDPSSLGSRSTAATATPARTGGRALTGSAAMPSSAWTASSCSHRAGTRATRGSRRSPRTSDPRGCRSPDKR